MEFGAGEWFAHSFGTWFGTFSYGIFIVMRTLNYGQSIAKLKTIKWSWDLDMELLSAVIEIGSFCRLSPVGSR